MARVIDRVTLSHPVNTPGQEPCTGPGHLQAKKNTMKNFVLLVTTFSIMHLASAPAPAQTASEIIKKAEDKMRGDHAYGEMKMTIVRPTWQREVTMKSWTMGDDYSLVVITAPARDKGAAFLKRKKEIWNWQPSIDRSIKLPPSMMMQSWMGSDFTNDDLVRQSSLTTDFTHKLLSGEMVDKRNCYKVELIPKPGAAVVWGKVVVKVRPDKLSDEITYFDEKGTLIRTMSFLDIKEIDGKLMPSKMRLVPEDKPGEYTEVVYDELSFSADVPDSMFSLQALKK